jgi:hypothetical protein
MTILCRRGRSKGLARSAKQGRHGIRFKIDYDDKLSPGFLVSKSPQPAFDNVLKDAGVPLPKPAEK